MTQSADVIAVDRLACQQCPGESFAIFVDVWAVRTPRAGSSRTILTRLSVPPEGYGSGCGLPRGKQFFIRAGDRHFSRPRIQEIAHDSSIACSLVPQRAPWVRSNSLGLEQFSARGIVAIVAFCARVGPGELHFGVPRVAAMAGVAPHFLPSKPERSC
jgi:hypothetical protein